MTTVICLDDYHCLDRNGRKEKGVTALDPKAQDFELMYNQASGGRGGGGWVGVGVGTGLVCLLGAGCECWVGCGMG